MKSHNRLLIGFGAGILALVIISIALVIAVGQQEPALLPENSPEGTVQRYMIAVQSGDLNKAYDYLAPVEPGDVNYKPQTREQWIASGQYRSDNTWKANLVKVILSGDTARVDVIIETFRAGGPFDNPTYSRTITFNLSKQGEKWLILSPHDLYVFY